MRNIALAACLLVSFAACDNNSKFDLNEAKTSYMEQTLPQVKKTRDQVVFQIKVCNENIDKLDKLKDSFQKQESKALVQSKIDQIVVQKKNLTEHVNKIDTEVEKGLALQAFNTIDGGGIRHEELKQITQDAQKSVSNAQTVNSSIAKEYGASTVDILPPKAIPVEPVIPKAEKVIPKQVIVQEVQQTQPPVAAEEPIITSTKTNRRTVTLKQQLPKLKDSRLMFEEQMWEAQRRNDTMRVRIYEEQLRIINNKIFDIETEIRN